MHQNNVAIHEFFHYPSSYFSTLNKEIINEDYFKNIDKACMERWPETCVTANKMLLYKKRQLEKKTSIWIE